jgi:lipopolysaccharide export system protein LptA
MTLSVSRLRMWFAIGAIAMIATVAGMYFYARLRVRQAVHDIPAKIGVDIQQTADGFSISKSVEGRTLFTVSASKAVQYKEGGRAALHNVKIVIYGRDAGRFDRITGDDFEYDPASGNVSAKGRVLIDLEANPEGLKHSDQFAPGDARNPIHLESEGLTFNKNSGDATATGKVVFQTPQASGSAVGINYVAKTGVMNLLAAIVMDVSRPKPIHLIADRGVISKEPRQVVLSNLRMTRAQEQLKAEHATFFLREDNTVDHIFAEGGVETEFHGRAEEHARSDHAELFLTGSQNQLTKAILSGNVKLFSEGPQAAEATAGRVTFHFGGKQILQSAHAEEGVKLSQDSGGGAAKSLSTSSGRQSSAQQIVMTAPTMDFIVKGGRLLERAETSGPPEIVITQSGTNQKTVVTAAKFVAKFTDKNRLETLHGEPDAKIVSSKIGPGATGPSNSGTVSDRVSTSQMLDVVFGPAGGVASVTQAGNLIYLDGTEKAWAQRGVYTADDQMLVLTGAPRVVDAGMTTTAQTIRINRVTGDAVAEGGVKSTYSDLKPQPGGGMLSSSDPIHVTSHSMTAHRSPAIAVYMGDARLWQNANVVEAPSLEFDRDKRSLLAQGTGTAAATTTATTGNSSQPVSTVLVQMDKTGKAIPVHITSARLKYVDGDRKIFLDGGVTVKGPDSTMTGQQMTVFLAARNAAAAGQGSGNENTVKSGVGTPGQIERIVAEGRVVITQPARRAEGERLVYTAADDKFVLTGGVSGGSSGGTPSIFDAERGKITGDSLTFYRHDDRVLVEGKEASPAVTRTQVAR